MLRKQPEKPEAPGPIAVELLTELSDFPEAAEIILGGHFALKHYLDYRVTHDVNAWWANGRKQNVVDTVRDAMERIAAAHNLTLTVREWGDVLSLDLQRENKVIFSFQIASRAIELEPSLESSWPPLRIETLADNLGAKMNALVNRGAPRDFKDIQAAVENRLCAISDCWEVWERKNPGKSTSQAQQQILHHLESLVLRRSLDEIGDPAERQQASHTRRWFREAFLQRPPNQ